MQFFEYKDGILYAEDVPIERIVEEHGTPIYIYSYKTLVRHVHAYQNAFKNSLICFALKANSNPAILRLLAKNGCGADIVSGGELYLALRAGIPPSKIVYAGVGKTVDEIRYALNTGILMFNVESEDELLTINDVACEMNKKAPIALRVNPDIDPKTHPYIATGLRKSKFGIPIEDALEYYRLARRLPGVEILGIHKHIGSQITKVSPFVDSLKRVIQLARALNDQGINIRHIDMGGGLGIPYKDENPPHPTDLSRHVMPLLKDDNYNLILEPGRSIVGNAGIFVTRVLYTKKTPEKEFIIVDGGMNDLLRPSLYNAYHSIQHVRKNRRKKIKADIVGPICESGDFLAKDRLINKPNRGDLLAVMSAGAYGYTMSSNYNSRPRPAEVLVRGDEFYLIRERETLRDLVRKSHIPDFLK